MEINVVNVEVVPLRGAGQESAPPPAGSPAPAATRSPDGVNSPVRQVSVPIRIDRKGVLRAMGQFYVYTLTLNLQPGEQRVAIAVRDQIAATTSYLSRAVTVAGRTAGTALQKP